MQRTTSPPAGAVFARWLRDELENRDWTLGQAEIQTGIGKSMLSRYQRGLSVPDLRSIRKLAKAFAVEPSVIEDKVQQQISATSPLLLFDSNLLIHKSGTMSDEEYLSAWRGALARIAHIANWLAEVGPSPEDADLILERAQKIVREQKSAG